MADARPTPVTPPAGATGVIVFADGRTIWGKGFGAEGHAVGELCFGRATEEVSVVGHLCQGGQGCGGEQDKTQRDEAERNSWSFHLHRFLWERWAPRTSVT